MKTHRHETNKHELAKWTDRVIDVEVGGNTLLKGRVVSLLFGERRYARFRDRDDPQVVAVMSDGALASFPLSWCSIFGADE